MTFEPLREHCAALPGATRDVKWGADAVYSVGAIVLAKLPRKAQARIESTQASASRVQATRKTAARPTRKAARRAIRAPR